LSKPDLSLTDNEGPLLALVLRVQPVTAYQIAKIYADSPVTNFNASKGKLYPLIQRLVRRGLLKAEPVAGDRRGTERLACTAAGRKAVKAWVPDVKEGHLLLEDPLRTKVQSFDLLTRQERIDWIIAAKAELSSKLEAVEEYGKGVTVPFKEFVHDNAVSSLRCRMDWLDRMLYRTSKEPEGGS
jgi:DNA-binding PadR family transcriptional regulator